MRFLIVGAGASYAEAKNAGLPPEQCPPLMKNFASHMWSDYNPHVLLSEFLQASGDDPGDDPRPKFFDLEAQEPSRINVERFFEFAFHRQDRIANTSADPSGEYDNLLYHGILNPLVFMLVQGLFRDGVENASLPLSRSVAACLCPGDVVVDLNYDTIFEIAAEQSGHTLAFRPNQPTEGQLRICKPHGSFNLLVRTDPPSFYFARPLFAGSIQPGDGARNFLGFVPPRLNKKYDQHWIATRILEPIAKFTPSDITFWGIGLTDSDTDLLDLYKGWCRSAQRVDFINPSTADVWKAERLLGVEVHQFETAQEWVDTHDGR